MNLRARRMWPLIAAVAAAGLAIAVSDVMMIGVGHAQQEDSLAANFGIYNGQVAAAADREQVGSTIDAGFTTGMVDNYYPLAKVAVSVAGTSAAASPADTGPFAQAVFGGQNVVQPQYVRAQYPGDQNPPAYSAGPATASASVTAAAGTAAATYGAAGNTTTAPPGTQPDGTDGGTASDSSYFDSALGFVTVGDSRVQHASYGAGVLTVDNVHVGVQVSNNATAFTKTISITVGGAFVTVAAPAPIGRAITVPVTIDQNGVTAVAPLVPGGPLQTATSAVNAALAAAGLSVHTVAPQVSQDGADLHIDAVGLVINQQNVGGQGGVPQQFVIHTLGEVVLDNEATAGAAQTDTSGLGTSGGGSPAVGVPFTVSSQSGATTSTGATSSGPVAQPSRSSTRPLGYTLTTHRPRWLLLAYLAWQALMLALAGALYLRREAMRRAG